MLSQGPQAVTMLQASLSHATPEVRAAAARLAFQLIEDLETDAVAPIGPVMPAVMLALQGFATSSDQEELLKECLESLISAADEEPEFFKAHGLQQLWPFLMEMCKAQHWADSDVRHSAMEAAMSFAEGLVEDFCKPEGLPFMEQLIALNIEWMLEVDEDVDAWTALEDAEEDDDNDGDAVQIGEENLDRLAEHCAEKETLEEVFMTVLFKVIRAALAAPACNWKTVRSVVMAVSQVVEYIDEDAEQGAAWVDQCVDFLIPHMSNPHPRVRYSAYQAVGQVAYDHEPYVQETHHEDLLKAIVVGLDDTNIRVASNAASAFCSVGEELDHESLEPFMDDIMNKLFSRLQKAESRTMQEQCLAGIAVIGEAAEELFEPYYKFVMPVLKDIIANAKATEQRKLRGKAFECVSLIGVAVGKETFAADGHDVMRIMMGFVQAGFEADDPTREYVHEAAGRIATVLEKDFKPYLHALLPGIFTVLAQKGTEYDPNNLPDDDDEDNEMNLQTIGGKTVGLRTAALDEMSECLSLITALIEAVAEEFCEFLPATCTHLMPLLDFPFSEDVREKAYKTWEYVVDSARNASEKGKCDKSVVGTLVGEFLKATVTLMAKSPSGDELDSAAISVLQAQANSVSGVIRKAGSGMLVKGDVTDLVKVLVELLRRVSVDSTDSAETAPKTKKNARASADSDDEDADSDDEGGPTHQSVRYSLVDVAGALMRSSTAEFAEVGLPTFMEVVKQILQNPTASEADRSLALYLADDVVDCLGQHSVPYWNLFMEHACRSVSDKCPTIRQHSASILGNGARQPIFGQIAPAAASQIGGLLKKFGERHRRRRAVNSEAKQVALAVDAGIRSLGLICEFQESNIGGDSTSAWQMWLTSMPLRYDREVGRKAHAQLVELVARGHPVVTAPGQLPRVLAIFADVYRTGFSNSEIDKAMAAVVARAGAASAQQFGARLPERQQKKIESMLKDGSGSGSQAA
ncbi:unnamed protein product [Polarella glacialis]|uniref:IPO4/5-like TPR repeats domain-containing protein n=1 Tax=Polarella glacialis TaxID=89957 RepID=A0A813HDP3_POLGL|nr:unnamed protein product [Polarella glacialis]